jgi:putative SOS response-associated peptidase YedK
MCGHDETEYAPAFRDAWRWARHCVVPVACFYEPDWRSGKAVPTRIALADGSVMGLAGLWEQKKDASGKTVLSYTLLTVNADDHALMHHFHRAGTEKRMPVILRSSQFDDWLAAPAERSMEFMRQFPAELMVASPAPNEGRTAKRPVPEDRGPA